METNQSKKKRKKLEEIKNRFFFYKIRQVKAKKKMIWFQKNWKKCFAFCFCQLKWWNFDCIGIGGTFFKKGVNRVQQNVDKNGKEIKSSIKIPINRFAWREDQEVKLERLKVTVAVVVACGVSLSIWTFFLFSTILFVSFPNSFIRMIMRNGFASIGNYGTFLKIFWVTGSRQNDDSKDTNKLENGTNKKSSFKKSIH